MSSMCVQLFTVFEVAVFPFPVILSGCIHHQHLWVCRAAETNSSWHWRRPWHQARHGVASVECLSQCLLPSVPDRKDTCKFDCRGLQDASARARDISCRLRKRPAIRHHWPSVAPPWDDPALGGQDHYVHQATRSPKHNGCASTSTLATCEVAHPLQDRCSGVPRPPWSGASVRNYADYVVRTTSRPTISWYRSVVCPSP